MQFDKGIWQSAWDVYRINLKTVGIAVALAIALDLVTDYLGKSGSYRTIADLIIWGMVAISMHGTVLLDKVNLATTDSKLLMPFVWRSFVLLALALLPFIATLFYFYEDSQVWLSIFKALPVLGLAALITFALLGTCLPAVVANGNKRFGAAFARGQRTFVYSALRLILGPGIVQTAIAVVSIYLVSRQVMTGQIFSEAGLSLFDLIFWPAAYAIRAYSVTLLAVILSRAYLIAEEKKEAPALAG